jgi:hypothetical protein
MQGFSSDEAVAALAGSRNVGFHSGANIHSTTLMTPGILRERNNRSVPSQETLFAKESDSKRTCSMDPYVFGGEYFNYLLDYHWEPHSVAQHASSSAWSRLVSSLQGGSKPLPKDTVWTCSESKRRRVEVLVDPLSDAYVREQKIKLDMSAKELREYTTTKSDNALSKGDVIEPAVSPCDQISMEAVDVMLLDDAMTLGWITKFSENELRFYGSFGRVFEKILGKGYNANELLNLERS